MRDRTGDLGAHVAIEAAGERSRADTAWPLYATRRPAADEAALTAIPYYLWGNREPGSMLVWIPKFLSPE